MENSLILLGLILIRLSAVIVVINRRAVLIMVMRMSGGVVIEIGSQRRCVYGWPMISADFVRMRLHGSGRAGPHK